MLRAWQFIKTVIGVIFRHPVTGATLVPILPDGRIVLVRRQDTGQWGSFHHHGNSKDTYKERV